jgi:hypothetical protein
MLRSDPTQVIADVQTQTESDDGSLLSNDFCSNSRTWGGDLSNSSNSKCLGRMAWRLGRLHPDQRLRPRHSSTRLASHHALFCRYTIVLFRV